MANIERTCVACAQTDDHPKHLVLVGTGEVAAFHMDCHASMECEVCAQQTRNKGNTKGDEFRNIIVTQDATNGENE